MKAKKERAERAEEKKRSGKILLNAIQMYDSLDVLLWFAVINGCEVSSFPNVGEKKVSAALVQEKHAGLEALCTYLITMHASKLPLPEQQSIVECIIKGRDFF